MRGARDKAPARRARGQCGPGNFRLKRRGSGPARAGTIATLTWGGSKQRRSEDEHSGDSENQGHDRGEDGRRDRAEQGRSGEERPHHHHLRASWSIRWAKPSLVYNMRTQVSSHSLRPRCRAGSAPGNGEASARYRAHRQGLRGGAALREGEAAPGPGADMGWAAGALRFIFSSKRRSARRRPAAGVERPARLQLFGNGGF